jgi:hypothetical protein
MAEKLIDYRRFGAPDRYVPAPRDKVSGLGSTDNEEIPQADAYPLEQPHAFTGIKSRSRFMPEDKPPPVGHGGATSGITPLPTLPDPNLESQFEPNVPMVDRFYPGGHVGRTQGFGVGVGRFLEAIHGLLYVRRRSEGGESAPAAIQGGVGGGTTYASDPIRWSDFGKVPGKINRRYTLRREFMQDAQTFLGLRHYAEKRAASSTSPVRMLPPRTYRLTTRTLPGSFGQTTEVLEG